MHLRVLLLLLLFCASSGYQRLVSDVPDRPKWTDEEIEAFTVLLGRTAMHVVEFGGGGSTALFSKHSSVISWTTVEHDSKMAAALQSKLGASSKLTVKPISGDFSLWETSYDAANEEGTFAEWEKYISEILFFGEAQGTNPYWVFNFGKAVSDVGIAALPLLSKTKGVMVVANWQRKCYSTLLQFYDLDQSFGSFAVLKPKAASALKQMKSGGNTQYNWCFSWKGGSPPTQPTA